MALVSKIREKSGLIVFIVGLGLLLFIIPFDSIYSFFGGRGEQPIGEVFGKPIYPSEWDVMAEFNADAGYYGSVQNGDVLKVQHARQYFEGRIFDTIINSEISKIGLQVSTAELKDYLIFGENPSPVIQERYTYQGPNGEEFFSKDSLLKEYNFFVNQAAATSGADRARFTNYWHYAVEVPVVAQRLKAKYVAMAKYAVVGTNDEATKLQITQNSKLVVDFIAKEANTLLDSSIKVSEDKIKSYYDAHKEDAEWKISEDLAKISYVLIDVKPTQEDIDATLAQISNLKQGFADAPNDTAFIQIKSDTKFGDNMQDPNILDVIPAQPFDRFQTSFSDIDAMEIANAPAGSVVGPFIYKNMFGQTNAVIAKVSSVVNDTRVRHILVTDAILADSIANALRADSTKFASLALKYSMDEDENGVPNSGGYYDVLPSSGLVPTFKSFALNNAVGVVGVVPSQFGYHVMQVVSKGDQEFKFVSYVEKNVVPTESTINTVYEEQGFGFMEAAESNYEAALKKFGFESLQSTLFLAMPTDRVFGYSEDLVNWVFAEGREVNEVSVPILLKDGRYLVVKIDGLGAYGVPSYEAIKDEMEKRLLQEAKLAELKKKVKGVGSLQEAEGLITAAGGVRESIEISLDMDAFPGFGQDVTAIAKTFLIKNLNEVNVIEGKQGIYLVVVKERNITPVAADKTEAIATVTEKHQSYVGGSLYQAMLRMADFRDWRMKAQVYYANQD